VSIEAINFLKYLCRMGIGVLLEKNEASSNYSELMHTVFGDTGNENRFFNFT
jgi:hypothetical protein